MPLLHLPDGFTSRSATLDDIGVAVGLFNDADREFLKPDSPGNHDTNETLGDWTEPGFDLDADTLLVFDSVGTLAGYQEAFTTPPHVRAIVWGRVHPDFRGRGLGSALLTWGVERAREMVNRAPGGAAEAAQARVGAPREALAIPNRPNEGWSMDFVANTLADGPTFRTPNAVDDCTRVCGAAF